ncbi:hypothetical protein [Nesterenkonia sp. CF4.4]|uniref:hypothetical protein n=1 Tax=Nesterenkonia sp. CF4.4 TaxID=3373079 RepID=UPI003EE44E7A
MPHLPKNNPVRFLVESAANGRKLTEKDLQILKNADLPRGESLDSLSGQVSRAAEKVAAAGSGGARNEAMRVAEREWGNIASFMTEDQSAISTTESAEPESLSSIGSRLFDQ